MGIVVECIFLSAIMWLSTMGFITTEGKYVFFPRNGCKSKYRRTSWQGNVPPKKFNKDDIDTKTGHLQKEPPFPRPIILGIQPLVFGNAIST